MMEDEVVKEVRAARDAFAASHGYDIDAIMAALRELTEQSAAKGWKVVRLPSRPVVNHKLTLLPVDPLVAEASQASVPRAVN